MASEENKQLKPADLSGIFKDEEKKGQTKGGKFLTSLSSFQAKKKKQQIEIVVLIILLILLAGSLYYLFGK